MFKNDFRSLLCLSVSTAALLSSSCDRIRTLAKEQMKTETATAGAVSHSSFGQITQVDSSNYEAFISQKNRIVIVDFYADWCGPCKSLGPVLEKAVAAHPGVVYLGKVNTDQAGKLASEQGVNGIPDVRIFKEGREVDRFVGFPGEPKVLAKIAALSDGLTPAVAEVKSAKGASAEPEVQPMKKDWLPKGMQRR
jgi:thioredoxin